MIPRSEVRFAGTGRGGKSVGGGLTPFFCKTCGKTMPAKQVMQSVDVCKKCRVGGRSGRTNRKSMNGHK